MDMRSRLIVAVLLWLSLSVGCGHGSSATGSKNSAVGPHGGFAVRLPNDLGYGEVVIEVGTSPSGQEPDSQVVVYFLKPDLKTVLEPLPSEANVQLLFPDKNPAVVPLGSQPKLDDPAGAGRFASPPGSYLLDEPVGELIAVIGGSPFHGTFRSVR